MTGPSSQQLRRRFTPFSGTTVSPQLPGAARRILAVGSQGDDAIDAALRDIKRWSQAAGVEAETASEVAGAMPKLSSGRWDLVLVGLGERPVEDLAWWTDLLRSAEGPPPVVAMVEFPSIAFVHEAEKLGVRDILALPIRHEDFLRICARLQAAAEEKALPLPPTENEATGRYALIGQHPSMLEIYKLIARVAKSNVTVLIEGESGTGKECVAREIHASSARSDRPFVAVNCAAIPKNCLESALSGPERRRWGRGSWQECALRSSVCRRQLRCNPRELARKRAVRARKRCIHGGHDSQVGAFRARGRRDDLPR